MNIDELEALLAKATTDMSKLSGIACSHGWDTHVCPLQGCGPDPENDADAFLKAAPSLILAARERDALAKDVERLYTLAKTNNELARILRIERDAVRKALQVSEDAMSEMFRYYDGGETKGSYDGKPERARLRSAWHAAREVLRETATTTNTPQSGQGVGDGVQTGGVGL